MLTSTIMEPTTKSLEGERQIRQSHLFYTTAIKISTFYVVQILTHTTTFLPPKWHITGLFQENVFHKPEALLRSCDLPGERNVCKNENLDDEKGNLKLHTRMTGTPPSTEKLDTCLQQLHIKDPWTKNISIGGLWSVSFCKGSQGLGISEVGEITKSASHFDHSA